MRRNKKLKWYAFNQELNSNKLTYINVLGNDLVEDILKRVKNKTRRINNYNELKDAVKSYLMYKYWGRCEYELIVSNWLGNDMEEKIDVWYQLEPNLDTIVEYINNELKLGFDKGE